MNYSYFDMNDIFKKKKPKALAPGSFPLQIYLSDCETPAAAPAGSPLRLTPKRNTILDKIAEFAKIIAGLNFCVRATLRLWHFECPPDTDVLKISSLPKRGTL